MLLSQGRVKGMRRWHLHQEKRLPQNLTSGPIQVSGARQCSQRAKELGMTPAPQGNSCRKRGREGRKKRERRKIGRKQDEWKERWKKGGE